MAAQRIFGIRTVGKRRFGLWTLFSIVLSATLLLSPPGERLEAEFGLRWLYHARGPLPPPKEVVLVTMDDTSASALGAGVAVESWPRTLHACLVQRLSALGAAVIVMDVNFESASRHDPPMDAYAPEIVAACDLSSGNGGTAQLGAAIEHAGNVLLASYLGQRHDQGLQMTWEAMPAAEVAHGALGVAPSPLPDRGERYRNFYTFIHLPDSHGGPQLETPTLVALAVQAFERKQLPALAPYFAFQSNTPLRSTMSTIRQQAQRDEATEARVRASSPLLADLYAGPSAPSLNVIGPPGALTEMAYNKVLLDEMQTLQAQLAGKAVFVGAAEHFTNSRIDTYLTHYPTQPGQEYGGVELVATAFANLRAGQTLHLLIGWQSLVMLAALGISLAAASWRWDPLRVLPAALVIALVYLACAYFVFAHYSLWLPQVVPVMVEMPLLMVGGTVLQYVHSRQLWREAVDTAARYVPPKARQLYARIAAGQERSELVHGTILATDVANFTPLVESFGTDPRGFVALLNEYFDAISAPIEQASPPGTVIDTAGDGLLAIWDAPTDDRATRLAACMAALRLRDAVAEFARMHPDTPMPTRIGLHAGGVAIGAVEVGQQRFFKAVGTVTNTAARIEALNKHLGTRLLASAAAVEGLEDVLLLRRCGEYLLPGRSEALGVVEIVATEAQSTEGQRRLVEKFAAALALYEAQRWEEAAVAFERVLWEVPGDGPSRFLLQRCGKTHSQMRVGGDTAVTVIDTK